MNHCGVFDNYENRVARVLVSRMYTPLLQRLHKQPLDVICMVDQMSESLHCLRYDAKILHRDVSVGNIMCEETEKGPNFILGDFDLAIVLNEDGTSVSPTGKRHVGTLPFMAQKLVEDLAYHPDRPRVLHELHHDYESLYWVALWCTMKADYDEQEPEFQQRIDDFLAQWEYAEGRSDSESSATGSDSDPETQPETISTTAVARLNLLTIAQTKFSLLFSAKIGEEAPPATERFKHCVFSEFLNRFRHLLYDAYGRDPIATAQRLAGPPDDARESGAAKAKDDTAAGPNNDDNDDDFWTRTEDAYVDKASIIMPIRDTITREAIKRVVETTKAAVRSHFGV
ncbi:hypothetical protein C8Q70DRAFT_75579 [Cubamyces menziesii]|nr:hypothetical protein C8Q70DRAFT_75579 [Cubamyces menziesii]